VSKLSSSSFQRSAIHLAARAFWSLPGKFTFARMLGRSYALRCVVFHDIAETESSFTKGMGVTISPARFESALRFISKHYNPVSLQDVLADPDGLRLPPRPLLVTFDDAYVAVAEVAAPMCRKFGVPAVFFVNAAFVDNRRLAPDNLVCYVFNTLGMNAINTAARAVGECGEAPMHTLSEVFSNVFPSITLAAREVFLDALRQAAGIDETRLAKEANLYITAKQLREMASYNFEIGNHTFTHVHSRSLSPQDFLEQVDRNKMELEAVSGTKVRSFSQPYGSSLDVTPELADHLAHSGHQAVFLSESVANPRGGDPFRLDRVAARAETDDRFFFELEVLPRLRTIRNDLTHKSGIIRKMPLRSPALRNDATVQASPLETVERRHTRA
jgi:peptidoglycan/xylan/chitin deacetylase (PgdA/CDA1 family)